MSRRDDIIYWVTQHNPYQGSHYPAICTENPDGTYSVTMRPVKNLPFEVTVIPHPDLIAKWAHESQFREGDRVRVNKDEQYKNYVKGDCGTITGINYDSIIPNAGFRPDGRLGVFYVFLKDLTKL